MNNYLKAKLVSWRKINVILFTDIPRPNSITVTLYKNDQVYKVEKFSKFHSVNQLYFFDIYLNEDYELGASYRLLLDSFPMTNIDVSEAIDFIDFDNRYAYNGDEIDYGTVETVVFYHFTVASLTLIEDYSGLKYYVTN